jgi:hypothetical protein
MKQYVQADLACAKNGSVFDLAWTRLLPGVFELSYGDTLVSLDVDNDEWNFDEIRNFVKFFSIERNGINVFWAWQDKDSHTQQFAFAITLSDHEILSVRREAEELLEAFSEAQAHNWEIIKKNVDINNVDDQYPRMLTPCAFYTA